MANRRQDGGSSSYPPPPFTASRIYIGNKAKEILATRDITGITKLVSNLCYGKETEQSSQSSKLLFDSFTFHFPNILALKLLQIYRFATNTTPKIRSFSLYLLDLLLIDLDDTRVGLKKESLNDIITHLNSCLFERESSDDDTDGDGKIAPSELGILMRSLGGNPTESQLKSIIATENLSSPFDFNRFLDLMAKHLKTEPFDRQLRDAFKVLDKEGSGFVSVADLRHILTSIGEKLQPSEFDEWIKEVDVGSDGKIRYEDFIARMVAK